MRFRSGRRRDQPEINLIAFIDVLLVVLIFLMVSTTFSRFSALKVSLPTASAQPQPAQPVRVTVAVDADGRFAVDQQRIEARDAQGLAAALRTAAQANPDCVLEIRADALASHQSVVHVMEAARLAGLQRLVFATQSGRAN